MNKIVVHENLVDEVAFAKIYGEPLFNLPEDLYIPPHALQVFLEAFSGPLDLLLYLIRKQNLDILDIPMAQVTNQYLQYINQIGDSNLELIGEYLLMAATLIDIKARLLLPPRKSQNDDGEVIDPRAELVQRLLVYEKIKLAAHQLNQLPLIDNDFFSARVFHQHTPPLPTVTIADLQLVWRDLEKRKRLSQHHRIYRESLSVREFMAKILRRLRPGTFLEFNQLYEQASLPQVVVNFIAILELAREQLIIINQSGAHKPIYIKLSYTPIEE